jgi:hypothetical protein
MLILRYTSAASCLKSVWDLLSGCHKQKLVLEHHKLVWFCQDLNCISAKIVFYSANRAKLCWHLGCLKHREGNWLDLVIAHSPWWIISALAPAREDYWGIWLLPLRKVELALLRIVAALCTFDGSAVSCLSPILSLCPQPELICV